MENNSPDGQAYDGESGSLTSPQSHLEKSPSDRSLNSTGATGPNKFSKIVSELGKKISRRSDPSELVQRNIIREDELSSPVLAANRMDLEKAKTQDALNRKLGNRPAKVDLKLRNILRVESADDLNASGQTLEKSIDFEARSNKLKSILKQRPEKKELEDMNIIKGGDFVDPSIQATRQALQRAQIENALENKLRDRPAIEDLDKIINFSEVVEVLPTFRKSEYNRKPDTNATFKKLTPQMKVMIREELNTFKKTEMPVHENSSMNTCFH